MATAFTAWLIAAAPMACTSARPRSRTIPAIAPATSVGRDEAETFSARATDGVGAAGGGSVPAAGGVATTASCSCWLAKGSWGAATLPDPGGVRPKCNGRRRAGAGNPAPALRKCGARPGDVGRYHTFEVGRRERHQVKVVCTGMSGTGRTSYVR